MKSLSRSRLVTSAAFALGLLGLAGAAQARADVYFSLGVPGVTYAPQPVYVDPQPVYVNPQPYYTAPAQVYVDPGYGWRQREWRREEWRRHEWREHERREHEGREHHGDRHWD
jgi:hypothetical protein